MCTTIGFAYNQGQVFGRTLELALTLDNKILYIPQGKKLIESLEKDFPSKYNTLGTGFFEIESFGDGINEHGLMGSTNYFQGYATFADEAVDGKINTDMANAFDYLLTSCKDIAEVKAAASQMNILADFKGNPALANHFFFMDAKGETLVLEPKKGELVTYDNPYGVLTNSPEFPWHRENLKNYIHLKAENTNTSFINGEEIRQFGEGTGMLGLPGDFTPPSRFVRAAYFVSTTDKELNRIPAILQGFRILSQFDIPVGSVVDPNENRADKTLYSSIMDTQTLSYHIKTHNNINLQSFSLADFKDEREIRFIELEKEMYL